jgi:hypothetical protein
MPQGKSKGSNAGALLGLLVIVSAGVIAWDAQTEHKVQPRTEWPNLLGTFVSTLERVARWKTNIRTTFDAVGARSLG